MLGLIYTKHIRFGPKVAQIGPKWDKSRTFSDQTSVDFDLSGQYLLKSDLKKSQICPIGANMTQFGANLGTSGERLEQRGEIINYFKRHGLFFLFNNG